MKEFEFNEDQLSLIKSYGILGFVFLLDLFVPLGAFGGLFYVIAMAAVLWLLKPHEILTFGVFCSILALGGFFSEDLSVGMEGLMNRVMAVLTIAAIVWLSRQRTEVEESYREQQERLSSLIDKRTLGLKQYADQLGEVKRRLAEAEELGPLGFWEYTPASRQMSWSGGVFSIYGHPVSDRVLTLQDFVDQCHPEDLESLQRAIQIGLTKKKSYAVEYRLSMPDGSLKRVSHRGRPVQGKNGEVAQLVGTLQDITGRKSQNEKAASGKKRADTLFQRTTVARALMIPDSKILEVNRAFCDWSGYSERELLQMPFEKLIHEEDRNTEEYAGYIKAGNGVLFQREQRFITKKGDALWGLLTVFAVPDVHDQTCYAAEIIDLSNLKRFEEAGRKSEEARRRTEESLRESEAARLLLEAELDKSKNALIESQAALAEATRKARPSSSNPSPPVRTPAYPPSFQEPLYKEWSNPKSLYATESNGGRSHQSEIIEEEDIFIGDSFSKHPSEETRDSYDRSPVAGRVETVPGNRNGNGESGYREGRSEQKHATNHVETTTRQADFQMAEEVIEQLFQLSDGLMAIIGQDGFYKRLSPALNNALGYQEGVLEDQLFLDFVHADDLETARDLLARLFAGETIDGAQFRHRRHDASYEWFSWNATYNQEHEVLYSVFYVVQPEQPAAKPKSRMNADWRRLTDKMPFQIWMIDTDRLCRYANKKVRDFTGLPFEQLEGSGWSKTLDSEHYREYMAHWSQHFDDRQPLHHIYRLRRNDGVYRWMMETGVPLFGGNGAFEGYLVTCMDVSNLQAVQTAFETAFEGAMERMDLSSALRPCKHTDCRNALADSIKIADVLIESAGEVRHPDLALLMEKAGKRLLEEVTDLIGFSDFDSNVRDVQLRDISLMDRIQRIIESRSPSQMEDRPRFKVSISGGDVHVRTDEELVDAVLQSLMHHVLQETGASVIEVEIRERGERGVVLFRGIGEVIDDLFFSNLGDIYRENRPELRMQRNAGLELSLARRLFDLTRGSLSIRRERGSGPVIQIEFPLAAVPSVTRTSREPATIPDASPEPLSFRHIPQEPAIDPDIALRQPATTRGDALPGRPQRGFEAPASAGPIDRLSREDDPAFDDSQEEDILIDNDQANAEQGPEKRIIVGETDEQTQRLIRSVLQSHYDLTFASDASEIFKSRVKYDLLLMDIQVQGDNYSLEVLRTLRKRPQYRHIPIIAFLTDVSNADQYEVMGYLGFDVFMGKPVSFVELLEAVERLIESHQG